MNHAEIRAIRGSLSRASFARLLGVTSLTVLRWELAEDNKEARRPRAKMIEALRKLAAEGVGNASSAALREDDDDDDGASEPAARSEPPRSEERVSESQPASADERLVLPLIERLGGESWRAAEDELIGLLSTTSLGTQAGRILATLGLAQAQLFGRLDVRGALTTLLPILDQVERGELPAHIAARAHVMGALLFSAPDSRCFDPGRVNVHAARADALLDASADDLRVFLATARISAARFLGPQVAARAYQSNLASLERASSPLARFLSEGLHGVAAALRGDDDEATRYGAAGLAIAERLELPALTVSIFADRAWRAVRGDRAPEAILMSTQRAREKSEAARLPPTEPLILAMACECEALCRLGRFSDAGRTAAEAMALAKRGGIARYALAVPVARMYIYANRVSELPALAEALESDTASAQRTLADVHAILVRGIHASLVGEYDKAAELAERVCSAPEATVGIDYLLYDAYFELGLAHISRRDTGAALAALERFEAFLAQRPSVWHSGLLRRLSGLVLLHQGRFAEARQRLESTIATFALLKDEIQLLFSRANLAMIARASGANNAQQQFEAVRNELERYGLIAPELRRRAETLSVPPREGAWREQSLTERLVVAVERLSIRGLTEEHVRAELVAIVDLLFPGRELVLGDEADAQSVTEFVSTGRGKLRIGVSGSLDPEQRAALRLLAAVTPLILGEGRASLEPEIVTDTVLPGFIAVAQATRQLKSEIARLSRSSATILITGESGSGKEVVARAVHDLSARADKPYVVFNCASIPRDLFESQLFGHKKGAFTGAAADSLGVIRAAHGGTLFLDEIGELPIDTQPKLLRFLENSEILVLGEQQPRRVDVRVLAATHRDLGRLVQEGRFREDLYYRLNVVPLQVPPLRERKEDVTALARLFIARLTPEGATPPDLSADATVALKAHTWPGNVRELRNVIERAMAYAPIPEKLHAEHLRIVPS